MSDQKTQKLERAEALGLTVEELDLILTAVATSGIDPSKMGSAMERLSLDKEDLKKEMAAEIHKEFYEAQELAADGGHELIFDRLLSKRIIKMGVGDSEAELKIGFLVSRDGERITELVPDLIRYVYQSGPKALIGLSPMQLINDIFLMWQNSPTSLPKKASW